MSVNRLEVIGRLGRDPELEEVAGGKTVCRLSIATERGGDSEEVDWHAATAWDRLAEVCDEYLAKGDRVFVAGPLTYSRWKDDAGQKRKSAELQVRRLELLGSPSGSGRGGGQGDRGRSREEGPGKSKDEKQLDGARRSGPGDLDEFSDDALMGDDDLPF